MISVMSDLHLYQEHQHQKTILYQTQCQNFFDKTEEMKTHIDYSKTELENEQDESGGRR